MGKKQKLPKKAKTALRERSVAEQFQHDHDVWSPYLSSDNSSGAQAFSKRLLMTIYENDLLVRPNQSNTFNPVAELNKSEKEDEKLIPIATTAPQSNAPKRVSLISEHRSPAKMKP